MELLYQRNIPVNIEDEMRTDLDLERLPSGKFVRRLPDLDPGRTGLQHLARDRTDRTRGRSSSGASSRQAAQDPDRDPGADVLGRSTCRDPLTA